MATRLDYAFRVRPLTEADGGGYLIEFPDLPGCMSDGETVEEAIANGADAVQSWINTAREVGDPVPPPSRPSDDAYSGRWNMRVPRSLHRRLAERANTEGVSLNTLAATLLAEGLATPRTDRTIDRAAPRARNVKWLVGNVAISDWARDRNMDPKRVRAKLRSAGLAKGRITQEQLNRVLGL